MTCFLFENLNNYMSSRVANSGQYIAAEGTKSQAFYLSCLVTMLAPVLLIPDSTLQQTTQNERLLLLFVNISDSSAICVVAQRYGVGLITLTTLGTFPETASTRQFNLLSISRVANSGQQTAADDIK
ncbi:hypothetical protein OUZ56_012667 [Daphnia magna]|uniref:Uncharacterized protein n=1 Tax=Daphnia magna TaxID=35525 RepID=A0ABQ9Z4V4_9CRUS|nr:hypothetical protein OUZ56_012667 [Daphnia magna]